MRAFFTWSELDRQCRTRPADYRQAILDIAEDADATGFYACSDALERVRQVFNLPSAEISIALQDIYASPYADRPGAITAIMASGRVQGDYLVIHPETYASLRATYGLEARCAGCGR